MTRSEDSPHDPALRQLHAEMTELGRILPADTAPPVETPAPSQAAPRVSEDFADVEDLFDNCPL